MREKKLFFKALIWIFLPLCSVGLLKADEKRKLPKLNPKEEKSLSL